MKYIFFIASLLICTIAQSQQKHPGFMNQENPIKNYLGSKILPILINCN